jgi:small GTP-binding protein
MTMRKGPSPSSLRAVLIGDSSVGKTCLLNRFVSGSFIPHEQGTVGADSHLYSTRVKENEAVFQIWDTAGQEKFRSLSPLFFRDSLGAIAVCDITNESTSDHLDEWIEFFTDVAGTSTVIAVAVNKADLATDIDIQVKKARDYAESRDFLFHVTSALDGTGVDSLFNDFFQAIVEKSDTKIPMEAQIEMRQPQPCRC